MTKGQKKRLVRLGAGLVLFIAAELIPFSRIFSPAYYNLAELIAYAVPYIVIGGDVLWRAVRNIGHGQVFDENFLMSIATIGVFALKNFGSNALGIGYDEAVFVMLFYQVGEFFQDYAVNRSRKSIAELMDIRPDYANVMRNGEIVKEDPEEVAIGDVIFIKAGERVPLDGIVTEGTSELDTAALTGESVPRGIKQGDEIISGAVNISGTLNVRVTKLFSESTVSRILELVENAGDKKAKTENFITRFARVYTPVVVCAAALLAVIPPLFFGGNWGDWISRGLIFLVVSCPCALVISVPLSFFGGIGGASRKGVLIKGSNYLEVLAKADTIVFDKTGTLTKGTFTVTAVHPREISKEALLEFAAYAEAMSDHPVAVSIKKEYGKKLDLGRVGDSKETPGHGVEVTIDGHKVLAGNGALMKDAGIAYHDCHLLGTTVHVAVDGLYAGHIIISDTIKDDSAEALKELKKLGIRRTIMLTGDREAVAKKTADELGLDEYHSELLPQQKVELFESFLGKSSQVAFVGDGINDAPVLARADIGIAMGAMGSDAAIEAADIVLMDDKPSGIATAVRIARKTLGIVRQNIIFALAIKAIVLILAAIGIATMWEAVFADVGVAFIATLNAMRTMRIAK